MLAITVLLLNQRKVTARELADKFNVSIRTIYRDIDAICQAGIPLVSFQGNTGGFEIMKNYKIDRQVLTLKDMTAILSALKGINTTLEDAKLDNAMNKISSLIPGEHSEEVQLSLEQVVVDMLPWGQGERDKQKLKTFHRGITECQLVKFNYSSLKGETLLRTVEPMSLIFRGYNWYLYGYCRERLDYRIFRLTRVKNIEILNEKFYRRELTYREFKKRDSKIIKMVHLVLKFSPVAQQSVEDYFDSRNIEKQPDGTILVRISFPEDEWIYSCIMGYGPHVEVLEPPHIRKEIINRAKKTVELYNKDL